MRKVAPSIQPRATTLVGVVALNPAAYSRCVSWLARLRGPWGIRRRKHKEEAARQLEAEARGEAAAIHSRKDLVRDQRYAEDYPSRGGGVVGR